MTIAPCREACPAGIDVPRYIRHIRNRAFDMALAVIREKIPFPAVCGYACVHPCESKCARIQYDEAIAIRMLKRAAYEKSGGVLAYERKAKPTGKRVAVIGAGPCGLTAAYYLAGAGHAVSVFEARHRAGGMLRYGIPEYRLPNDILDREIAMIASHGVEIVTDTPVSSARELLEKGYDAVLAASGAWRAVKMGIVGETSSLVMDGLAFLQEVNAGARSTIGKKVIVVGGGNTAIDAARACVRMGAKAVLIYRRGRGEMPASPEEVAEAREEGVRFEFMAAPIRISKGKAVCIRMEAGPLDASGRPRPVPIEGSEFALSCDAVIMAVGQAADAGALNLEANGDGTAWVDAALATPVPGIFAAGDAVLGPKTIIDAIAQGRLAAISIDRYLGGEGRIDGGAPADAGTELPETKPPGMRRPKPERVPVKSRLKGFGVVEAGYDEETAAAEAERCLACDIRQYTVEVNAAVCKDCGYCREMCHMDIFAVSETFNAGGYKPAVVKSSDRCVGCLKCLYVCPDFAIAIKEGRMEPRPEAADHQ
ncbi:MAG: FAD-dependent oxidoreductase [Syntrophales bacterium]